MTIAGLALVLTAAFCHATWNFFVKRIGGGPELIWLFSLVAIILYLPAAAYILVIEPPAFNTWQLVFIGGSVLLHLAYFMLLQVGYRHGDLSLVYPTARATGPLLSVIVATAFLGEHMTAQTAIGAALIIIGVLCLTHRPSGSATNMSTSLLFGLAVGIIIAGYTVWDAHAVATLLIPPLLMDYASSLGRVALLTPLALRRWEIVKTQWRDHRNGVITIAIFSPLAYILVLYAMTFTPVVYVAPAREVSVLLTVLAGSILLGEGDLPRRLAWSAVMLSGVALLATA